MEVGVKLLENIRKKYNFQIGIETATVTEEAQFVNTYDPPFDFNTITITSKRRAWASISHFFNFLKSFLFLFSSTFC